MVCSDKPLVYVHEELRHSEDTEQLEVLALVCSVQVSTVQYSTVQYSTVQYMQQYYKSLG